MHQLLLNLLRGSRPLILSRWKEQLMVEPVSTAMANPETLAYLMPWTLEEVTETLIKGERRKPRSSPTSELIPPSICECGLNPLLVYFSCLERVLAELTASAEFPLTVNQHQRTLFQSQLHRAISHVAQREIESFCAVCEGRRHASCSSACTGCPKHAR